MACIMVLNCGCSHCDCGYCSCYNVYSGRCGVNLFFISRNYYNLFITYLMSYTSPTSSIKSHISLIINSPSLYIAPILLKCPLNLWYKEGSQKTNLWALHSLLRSDAAVAPTILWLLVGGVKMQLLLWVAITPRLWSDAVADTSATAILRRHHVVRSTIWNHGLYNDWVLTHIRAHAHLIHIFDIIIDIFASCFM